VEEEGGGIEERGGKVLWMEGRRPEKGGGEEARGVVGVV